MLFCLQIQFLLPARTRNIFVDSLKQVNKQAHALYLFTDGSVSIRSNTRDIQTYLNSRELPFRKKEHNNERSY